MRVLCVRSAVSEWRGFADAAVDRKESAAEETIAEETVTPALRGSHRGAWAEVVREGLRTRH